MKLRRRRLLKIAMPWFIGLVILSIGFWIWDSKNYPLPRLLNPARDPFAAPSNLNVFQRTVIFLQAAKEERFWDSFRLAGTKWRATHWDLGTVSTIRFTDTHVYVDPPDLKIGIPFVSDTRYELLYSRIIEAVIPVPGESGVAVAEEKRASFEDRHPDGRIGLQTTADDDFWLEQIEDD